MSFPLPLQAALWGLLGGSALVIGAAAGYAARIPARLVALIMAFGAGVLVSALSFELMAEAYARGGLGATATGFALGALGFTAANAWISRRGARHRKRSGGLQSSEAQAAGSGLALAIGALIDGVPESIALGVGLLEGKGVGVATVIAVFLSNLPEGLSSAAGMRRAGRSPGYVFGVWGSIALASGAAAFFGCAVFRRFPPEVSAATLAVAAGAILAMIADTMLPEAYEGAHESSGLVTAAGFLVAFALSRLAG